MISNEDPSGEPRPDQNRYGSRSASNWAAWLLVFLLHTLTALHGKAEEPYEILLIAPEVGYEIDADERSQFGLFSEIDGFVSAQIRQVDGAQRIEITYQKEGRWLRLERPIDKEELEEIRATLGRRAASPREGDPSGGRGLLVTHAIAYGLWLYGAGIPIVFDIDSARGQVGTVMLSGGTAAALAISETRGYARGKAYAEMLSSASYAGLYYGSVPDIWASGHDEKRLSLGLMVGVPAATAGMYSLLRRGPVTHGEAALTSWGMLLGGGYGVLIPYLLNADHLEAETERRVYLAGAGLGIPLGGWLGWRIAHDKRLSRGRASTLRLGSVLGTYYAYTMLGMLVDLDDFDHPKRDLFVIASGMPLGTAAAYRLTKNESYSAMRARLLGLGGLAGGLVGMGLSYVFIGSEDYRPSLAASAVGSGLGVWLTHAATRSSSTPVTSSPVKDVSAPRFAWEIGSLPELLFSLMPHSHRPGPSAPGLIRARF